MVAVKSIKSASHQFMKEVKNAKNKIQKDASNFVPPASKPTAQKPQVYTTVDNGKLHIGIDENYAGSIDSYNNFLTRFFAKLFGWSTEMTINNKTRQVSKSDYMRWLNSNTAYSNVTKETVQNFADFHKLDVKAADGSLGRMRDHLSQYKTEKLFEKMVLALAVNKDVDAAKKYAAKGANLDGYFWVRDSLPISFTTIKADLDDDKAVEFRAGHLTPLLFAAERGYKTFCDFLRKLQANQNLVGEYVLFSKKVIEVSPITTLVKSEEFKSNDGRVLTRITLKTSTTLQIEDQTTPKVDCKFAPDTSAMIKIETKSPAVVEKYSKELERFTTRYL